MNKKTLPAIGVFALFLVLLGGIYVAQGDQLLGNLRLAMNKKGGATEENAKWWCKKIETETGEEGEENVDYSEPRVIPPEEVPSWMKMIPGEVKAGSSTSYVQKNYIKPPITAVIPGTTRGNGTVEGSGTSTDFTVGVNVGDKDKPEEGSEVNPPEEKKPLYYYSCGCGDKGITISELGKKFRCPEPGHDFQEETDDYYVWIGMPTDYNCDSKWKCPRDYEVDWGKVIDDCKTAKKSICTGGENPGSAVTNACKAIYPGLMDQKCFSEEDCTKMKQLLDQGFSSAQIQAQGLPNHFQCEIYN